MKTRVALAFLLLSAGSTFAAIPFDCGRGIPLQKAIDFVPPGETLVLYGACRGPLVISKHLTLASDSKATITGDGKDAITVNGPRRVTLKGLSVEGGYKGVVGSSGAQLTILDSSIHGNKLNGIFLANSAATISGSSTSGNCNNGLDAEASSAVILSGAYSSTSNGVFGVNINASSSLAFSQAQVTVSGNILGIQIATSASAFISDPLTVLTVKKNLTTRLTIVSGAHMVAFGGTIKATGNGVHGVSVDSKAGLDLDAAAALTASGNKQDGVHLEETSVLTMFNTPAFSGAQGTTTVTAENNGQNGISVLTGSNLTVIHQALIMSSANSMNGIQADNGSAITLILSTVTGNTGKDVALSFGSRADITTSAIGTLSCDATVLLRGGLTCPRP